MRYATLCTLHVKTNVNIHTYFIHAHFIVWIIHMYAVYISKSVFTLIDTRIKSISELYSGAGMRPAISICRRVCARMIACA